MPPHVLMSGSPTLTMPLGSRSRSASSGVIFLGMLPIPIVRNVAVFGVLGAVGILVESERPSFRFKQALRFLLAFSFNRCCLLAAAVIAGDFMGQDECHRQSFVMNSLIFF